MSIFSPVTVEKDAIQKAKKDFLELLRLTGEEFCGSLAKKHPSKYTQSMVNNWRFSDDDFRQEADKIIKQNREDNRNYHLRGGTVLYSKIQEKLEELAETGELFELQQNHNSGLESLRHKNLLDYAMDIAKFTKSHTDPAFSQKIEQKTSGEMELKFNNINDDMLDELIKETANHVSAVTGQTE